MPVIGKPIYKKILLPTEGAYVVVLTNPKADLWEGLSEISEEEAGGVMLAKLIVEWNFTDAQDKPAPITPENVKAALSTLDIAKINKELGFTELLPDAKKNSSLVTSPATDKATPPSNTQS